MRLTRCRLRHCRCLLYGASVKLLGPFMLMRHAGVILLSSYRFYRFWLALVFPLQSVLLTKSATSQDRTHDLKIMRLTRCRLRFCRCLLYGASVKLLEPLMLMRHSGVTLLSGYRLLPLLVGSGFPPPVCITVTKSATSEDRTHDLKNMRLTRCRLRYCRCLLYGASVKLLEPCTLMRHSGRITLLSSYLLCCFRLALVFSVQPVLLWQKVRQLRMELTTLRLWDLRATDCVIVAVSVIVHQWSCWNLVRKCAIPK